MTSFMRLLQNRKTLIVSLPSNRMEVYEAAVAGGADVVKIHINVEHRASGNHFGTLEDNLSLAQQITARGTVPVGIVPGDSSEKVSPELMDALIGLKFDFISVYGHHAPPWLLGEKRINKMIAINDSYSPAHAQSLGLLGADVVEASVMRPEQYGTPLTIQDLAAYQVFVRSVDRPVVVPTQKLVDERDLASLFQTGIKGLMIGAIVTGDEPESIYQATKRYKEAIEALAD